MNPWTDDITAELVRYATTTDLSAADIAARLGPGFTGDMVRQKRNRLGLSRTGAALAEAMAVGARKTAAKWAGRSRGGKWTMGQDEFLRANAKRLTMAEVGAALGKSAAAVKRRADRLNVSFAKDGHRAGGDTTWVRMVTPMQASANDAELVAKFLAERPVTRCPEMPAWGAVVPEYIGRGKAA